MLEMRPECESCARALPADSLEAFICSYECTFCRACVDTALRGVCPNCRGQLVQRPSRQSAPLRETASPEPLAEARMRRYAVGSVEGGRWLEFLRVPALSVGVYRLQAGEADPQQPHREDEVYYVLSGTGRFRAGDDVCEASSGDVLYVPKGMEHRFFDISSDLTLLVFFAPPEGST